MKKQNLLLSFVAAIITSAAIAQTVPPPPPPVPPAKMKEENITIRKKGDSKEKMVIVIDGDKITVNGKPLVDLKNENIEITTNSGDVHGYAKPPGNRNYNRSYSFTTNTKSNSAMLGVMPADDDKGAKITEVTKGSAAEKAGLKKGDIITKIGDDDIEDAGDVYDAINDRKPDDKVTIAYERDGKKQTTDAVLDKSKNTAVTLSSRNNDVFRKGLLFNQDYSFAFPDKPRLGLRAQDTEDNKGVTVQDIGDDDSPAAKAGLKEDDIIMQINGKDITSVKDIRDFLDTVKPGDKAQLQYKRGGALQTTTVHFPKDLETSDL